ncbi:MAG TPA: GIY-YIG nuclease family protein [Paludibacter sp.]
MVGCYIIFSDKLNKFYIGATQEDISLRIEKHNQSAYGNHRFTALADDWKLFLFLSTNDYAHAIRLERKIKSMKSVQYIKNLIKFPELLEKLISSTRLSR